MAEAGQSAFVSSAELLHDWIRGELKPRSCGVKYRCMSLRESLGSEFSSLGNSFKYD